MHPLESAQIESDKKSSSRISSPELVAVIPDMLKQPEIGLLMIKAEENAQIILGSDKRLSDIYFYTTRLVNFWNKAVSEILKKQKLARAVIYKDYCEVIMKSQLGKLVSIIKDFFCTYYDFGMPIPISAGMILYAEGADDLNQPALFQSWRDARNIIRPKIKTDATQNENFSGSKGNAIAFEFLDEKTRSIIPGEDLNIFFELARQIASLAGYRMHNGDILPVKNTNPQLFSYLRSITNKISKDKKFNWRAAMYYSLNKMLQGITEKQTQMSTGQAINNLLTTLRYNRWQNLQRLTSKPAYSYLNIISKWLTIISTT